MTQLQVATARITSELITRIDAHRHLAGPPESPSNINTIASLNPIQDFELNICSVAIIRSVALHPDATICCSEKNDAQFVEMRERDAQVCSKVGDVLLESIDAFE